MGRGGSNPQLHAICMYVFLLYVSCRHQLTAAAETEDLSPIFVSNLPCAPRQPNWCVSCRPSWPIGRGTPISAQGFGSYQNPISSIPFAGLGWFCVLKHSWLPHPWDFDKYFMLSIALFMVELDHLHFLLLPNQHLSPTPLMLHMGWRARELTRYGRFKGAPIRCMGPRSIWDGKVWPRIWDRTKILILPAF